MENNIFRFKTNSIDLYNYLIPSMKELMSIKDTNLCRRVQRSRPNQPCRFSNSDGFQLGGGKQKAASKAILD